MVQFIIPTVFGAILGAVVSTLTFVFFTGLKKHSENQLRLDRENIMHSIGELCAEIEILISSNKAGTVNSSGIQNVLRKKHEEILRLLKPNMHILDTYFVKYIDLVQADYSKLMNVDSDETEALLASKKSISFVMENKNESSLDLDNSTEKNITSTIKTGSLEHDMHVLENAFFKDSEKTTDTKENDFLNQNENFDLEVIIEEEKKPEAKKQAEDIKPVAPKAPTVEPPANDAVAEEEFCMETIMDLDISRLNRMISPADLKTSTGTTAKKDPYKFPDTSKKEVPLKTTNAPVEPKREVSAPVIVEAALSKKVTPEQSAVFDKSKEKKPSEPPKATNLKPEMVSANHNHATEEKKDDVITGDDIADQIDSFFGFKD